MINMPLPSRDKILQIFLSAYLQLQSPYYFRKVVWSLSLDYFVPGSTSCVPCVPSSFIQIILPSFPGMEYVNVVSPTCGWGFTMWLEKKNQLPRTAWMPLVCLFLWLHCAVELKKKHSRRPNRGMKTDVMGWYELILCIRHNGTFHLPLRSELRAWNYVTFQLTMFYLYVCEAAWTWPLLQQRCRLILIKSRVSLMNFIRW